MPKVNDLIEWDYLGSHFSVYVKHFTDDEGKKGMTLLFEDVTNEKITEMVVPPRAFAKFLQAVNDGAVGYRGLL